MSPLEAFCGSPLVHRFGCGLLHFLWQGLLIAMLLAVAMRLLRGSSAGGRYLTAWAALLAMALSVPVTAWLTSPPLVAELAGATAEPPSVGLPTDSARKDGGAIGRSGAAHPRTLPPAAATPVELPAAARSESPDSARATIAPLAVRASQWVRPALPWVVCAWALGTLALAIWRLGGWVGLRRLCCLGTRPASNAAGQMLGRLAARLGVHRAVRLLESTLVEVPTVIGWLRPVILLPASILAELPAEQLELILAHELAHIRRHDFLLNLLQTAIETLLFYHPATWWVSLRIRLEREACCDDLAVAGCGDRLLYARALTRLEELRHEPAGLLPARMGVAADGAPLLARIRRVLDLPGDDQEGRRTWLGGSVAVLLLIGALLGYVATASEVLLKPADRAAAKATLRPGEKGPPGPSSASSSSGAEWGEAVEGVQARVRAAKPRWNEGAKGRLWADVRNQGKGNLLVDAWGQGCELEVDGEWYRRPLGTLGIRPALRPFPPGRQYDNIAVEVDQWWELKSSQNGRRAGQPEPVRLVLTPGTHTVRVAFLATAPGAAPGQQIRAVSNPIAIEIISAKEIAARPKRLKSQQKAFELRLAYHGPRENPYQSGVENPFRSLVLHTIVSSIRTPSGWSAVSVSEEQATRIIDHLEREGFLTEALPFPDEDPPAPDGPAYTLTVKGPEKLVLYQPFGWGLTALDHLESLRTVLDGDAATALDQVLARLEPQQKEWEAVAKWGQAVEGVQVRLRAERSQWKQGVTPQFSADVRNLGTRNLLVYQAGNFWTSSELEIDGRWYRRRLPEHDYRPPLSDLVPGRQFDNVFVELSRGWYLADSPGRDAEGTGVTESQPGQLKLAPGKHTFRVAVTMPLGGSRPGDYVRVISNPVQFEIAPGSNQQVGAAPGDNADVTSKSAQSPADNDAASDRSAKLVEAFEQAEYHWQQLEIAQQMATLGDRSVVARLSRHLESEDEHLRCNAGFALAGLGDDRGLNAILSELTTKKRRPSDRPRSDTGQPALENRYGYYAIHVLGKLRDKRAVPALIELLEKEPEYRQIEWALGEIGDKRAIAALKRVLEHTDPHRRLWAGCALAKLADPVGLPTVAEFLKDPQWTYRRYAVEGLGASGDTRAVPHLIGALSDEKPDVRVSACKALAQLKATGALADLEKLLDDRTMTETSGPTMVRDEASQAIKSIRSKQAESGQAVAGRDDKAAVAQAAAEDVRAAKASGVKADGQSPPVPAAIDPVRKQILPGGEGSSGATKPRYAGEGLVVDDATGKPVEQIAIQEGVPHTGAESGIMWITAIQSPKGVAGGRFDVTHGWVKEGKVRIRIMADGYLPEVAILDTEDGLLKAPLVMRLRRGEAIRGRVIDHAGKPVAGAEVFLGGPDRHAEIVDGNAVGLGGKREKTDADGRFVIHGAAPGEVHQIVVLPPGLHVWTALVLELGKELTVKLPEPATLVIRYDIPGDVPEGRFRIELKTWDMPDWNGKVSSVQNPTAKNQGEVVLKNMTPGIYDVIRMKLLRGVNSGTEAFCDRRDVTLEAGKTTTLQFVRKKAFAIEGDLVGPEGTGIAEAFVYVRSPKATGDPRSLDDWKLPIYDGTTTAKDGKFKTAPIEPGEYLLVAEWFAPESQGMGFGMGWPLPALVGKAKVTVPEDGPPPRVRIEMKRRETSPKAPPARAPAKASAEASGETPPTKRVVDAEGKPIAGAKVGFYENRTPRGERPFSSTVTDEDGKFPCPDQAPDKVRFSFYLVVSAPGFRTGEWLGNYRVDGRRHGAPLPDTLRLDRPVTISGTVLGSDGKPLAGVRLAVDYFNERGTWANPRRIQSDEQGRFKIDDLPPADIFIRYEKGQNDTLQGAGDAQLSISHVRAKDGEQVENVLVDLSKATCVLEGQVVDHEGKGIVNASVKATFAASAMRLAHYAWARTDQDGRYRIGGLPPHEFLVSASTKNHFGEPGERVKLEPGETKTLRLLGYLSGHPAPEPKPDDARWGKPAGDLRVAIGLRPSRETYSMGETVEARPILRNTGTTTATLIHDFAAAAELRVADEAGKAQMFSYKGFSGRTVSTTYVLEPGHEVDMRGSVRLKLVGTDSTEDLIQSPGTPLAFPLKCRPGAKYTLSYDLGKDLHTGDASLVVKE